jgi:Xaa-Pro aminopeptidase
VSLATNELRIGKTRAALQANNVPALLITNRDNVGWMSGFTGSSGFVVVTPDRALFATDFRYVEQATAQCPGFEIVKLATSAPDEIATILRDLHPREIGFEADHLTVQLFDTYRAALPATMGFVPTKQIVSTLRQVKDAEELATIERAVQLADCTFQHIVPFLKPGAVERDIMLEMEWFMRKHGADVAFDTIVASGPRSALPHGRAAERVLQPGDFVTLDFGARLDGYCSDITRTVVLGEPTERQREIYGIVIRALETAIAAIRPGAEGKKVDEIARDLITEAGYGDNFGHGLGHGLGRAVHDGPGFSKKSELTLAEGMVLTVEPGIYIPGWGGVRVEHDIVVGSTGARILDESTIDLLAL